MCCSVLNKFAKIKYSKHFTKMFKCPGNKILDNMYRKACVRIKSNRVFEGTLVGCDEYMNLVLINCKHGSSSKKCRDSEDSATYLLRGEQVIHISYPDEIVDILPWTLLPLDSNVIPPLAIKPHEQNLKKEAAIKKELILKSNWREKDLPTSSSSNQANTNIYVPPHLRLKINGKPQPTKSEDDPSVS